MNNSGKRKVLVVDDNMPLRMAIKEMLEAEGHEFLQAEDGKKCLRQLEEHSPDLVLLDILMPGTDGISICREIKEDDRFKDIPVIMLTAVSDVENRVKALTAGANDYLQKPFEKDELLARVNSLLKTKGFIEQLQYEAEKRKNAERALKTANDSLEQQVKERTAELRKANEQLMMEIGERKQAEKDLLESENKFRTMNKELTIGLCEVSEALEKISAGDPNVKIPETSEIELITELKHLVNLTAENVQEIIDLSHEFAISLAEHFDVLDRVAKGNLDVRVSGVSHVDLLESLKKVTNKMIASISSEISERREAEAALKDSEVKHRTLFEASADGIVIADIETGRFVDANFAMTKLLGYSQNELKEMRVTDIHPKEDLEYVLSEFQAQARGEKQLVRDIPCLRKDGKIIYVDINATPVEIDGRKCQVGFFRDITERKEIRETLEQKGLELEQAVVDLKDTQAQMIQSEKMASVGQLAAGIAHEINNPTGFVNSNLNTLAEYQEDMSKLIKEYRGLVAGLKEAVAQKKDINSLSDHVDSILAFESGTDIDFILDDAPNLIKESQDGAGRIKKIVLDLKDFAHPGEEKMQDADINKCVESTLNVVWNEIKYKATVNKEYGDLPVLRCYPQQLNQVFMNLLVNAAQAIEKQGEISILTRVDNGNVKIKISDTGSGIAKENLSKIFDPFFTSKEVGKGTGLGLHIAYGIIAKHNGTIDVESSVGKGTTFTIQLPVDRS